MMKVSALSNARTRALALVGAAALSLTMIVPALADTITVTTTVPTGTLTATLSATALTGAIYPAGADSTATLNPTLTVDDPTGGANGTNTGWSVTLEQTADFTCTNCTYLGSGSNTFVTIDQTNMALTSAGSIALVAGQDINGTNGPKTPAALSTPTGLGAGAVKVITAAANYGNGRYTEALAFTLTIPQFTRPGNYSGTLTMTLAAAP